MYYIERRIHFFEGDSAETSDEDIRVYRALKGLEDDVLIPVVQQVACLFCRRGCFLCLDFIASLTISACFYPLRSFRPLRISFLLSLNLLESI